MKKSTTITLVALLAIAMIIPQTLAATDQGLFYRVEDGDSFYFTLELEEGGMTLLDEIIYAEIVDANKPIPEPLTNLTDLVELDKDYFYENGSSIGMLALIFNYAPQFEYPVGNWSLITTLAATDIAAQTLVDIYDFAINQTEDYWGYSYKFEESVDVEATVWLDYSKFDGMLYYFDVEFRNNTDSELLGKFEAIRFSYHTLSWGCHGGEEFNFHLAMSGDDFGFQNVDEDFYLEIDEEGLPIIPYLMDEWDDIPYIGGNLYWANDTIFFDPILSYSWRVAVPIGNWSLLDEFIDDKMLPADLELDASDPWFWGYSWSDTMGDILVETHTDYLKVDGVVARHSVVFTNTTSSATVGTITIERLNIEQYTDRTAPEITNPDDVTFVVGATDQNITWTPTDDNPTTYEISVNGTVVDSGSWTSNASIVLELDDFEVGEYNCTITVYDIAGNSVTDLVVVTVTAPGGGIGNFLMDNILYIAIGAGALILIGVIVILRKR